MDKFAIIADSTCNLTEEFRTNYDIRVLPGHIVYPDKSEGTLMPDWGERSDEEFYRDLKRDPNSYSTSPANVGEFAEAMKEYAAQGRDMLVMTISSGISGAFNFAIQAKKMVQEEYPNAKIICVDSLRFGPGFGLMVIHASMAREQGMTLEETAEYLEQNKNRYHQAGWHDDLSFVAKKGRVTHAKAFFGTLAGVKPIGEFDYNGLTTVIGKVKGTKAAFATLLSYIEQTADRPEEQIFFITHTNREKQAMEYKAMLEERFHPKAVHVSKLAAVCGVNTGPGLLAAYYVGKPISSDLSEERAIVERCINAGE